VTDVNRDGNLKGPNFDLLKAITSRTKMPITASGGVASVSDLTTLQNIPGVDGAIVGKALYTGAMKLSDALAACR
ncbi:MAG: bifunctional 1-(5-phosphoribosyl)-5-((5-phosphoribosylamino)methylideneamino)imidazole-4-carboxamide isomerase/phosphoribosylanthranilate isomerase PriA, partial [Actinobacteria bacterium]|nr:bifunctional 1-(5-phosphoribosyl)-5-((5-phosphoribosylamino)methylideneamino)imidazole-4-carboxamide isomerase/phosphoribosylanthranilate isomerase PriA [Actinomycetota bacterium]